MEHPDAVEEMRYAVRKATCCLAGNPLLGSLRPHPPPSTGFGRCLGSATSLSTARRPSRRRSIRDAICPVSWRRVDPHSVADLATQRACNVDLISRHLSSQPSSGAAAMRSKPVSVHLTLEDAKGILRLRREGVAYSRIAAAYDVDQRRVADMVMRRLLPRAAASLVAADREQAEEMPSSSEEPTEPEQQ